jgi:hypothetical protein
VERPGSLRTRGTGTLPCDVDPDSRCDRRRGRPRDGADPAGPRGRDHPGPEPRRRNASAAGRVAVTFAVAHPVAVPVGCTDTGLDTVAQREREHRRATHGAACDRRPDADSDSDACADSDPEDVDAEAEFVVHSYAKPHANPDDLALTPAPTS